MAGSSDERAPKQGGTLAGFAALGFGVAPAVPPSGRRHAAPEPAPETVPSDVVPDVPPPPSAPLEPVPESVPPDGLSSPVRPYFFTRGRTRSTVELEIETLVTAVPGVARPSAPALAAFEHCHEARSVAEVAALMGVPLGVARVLLGDLAEAGAVVVHDTASAEGPALALMQRVLIGLRNL